MECVTALSIFKGTLHSKLTLGSFSWPETIYYFDLSLTRFTFVKLELRVQGTHFYGDAGQFDGIVALTSEFGANGYITELTISSPW